MQIIDLRFFCKLNLCNFERILNARYSLRHRDAGRSAGPRIEGYPGTSAPPCLTLIRFIIFATNDTIAVSLFDSDRSKISKAVGLTLATALS